MRRDGLTRSDSGYNTRSHRFESKWRKTRKFVPECQTSRATTSHSYRRCADRSVVGKPSDYKIRRQPVHAPPRVRASISPTLGPSLDTRWRRGQDSNLRWVLPTHAFQACPLSRSGTSPRQKFDNRQHSRSNSLRDVAERAGFEPAIPVARDTGFRNRRFQPLSHLSANCRDSYFTKSSFSAVHHPQHHQHPKTPTGR